jgi:hypothetical protein
MSLEVQAASFQDKVAGAYGHIKENAGRVILAGLSVLGTVELASVEPAAADTMMEVRGTGDVDVQVTARCDYEHNITSVVLYSRGYGPDLEGELKVNDTAQSVANLAGGELQFLKFPTQTDHDKVNFKLTNQGQTASASMTTDCFHNSDVAAPFSGYWMVGEDGHVYDFGLAGLYGNKYKAVDIEPSLDGGGYWLVDANGSVAAKGNAPELVKLGETPALRPGETVTSLSKTASGKGYWLFTTEGRVLPFGDAPFLGDMSNVALNAPIEDSVPSESGKGYFMVAKDGGVFTFGDAKFAGSTGDMRLNQPVMSLVPDPDGSGYWLVAKDGGVFAFNANFLGSMGGTPLNRPITGMVASGDGYIMTAEDGGIFTFGENVQFYGSLGKNPPASPIVAVAAYNKPGLSAANRETRRAEMKTSGKSAAAATHLGRVTIASR